MFVENVSLLEFLLAYRGWEWLSTLELLSALWNQVKLYYKPYRIGMLPSQSYKGYKTLG